MSTMIYWLPAILSAGAIGIVGYAAWRNHRRAQDAKLNANGGGGGPKEPA